MEKLSLESVAEAAHAAPGPAAIAWPFSLDLLAADAPPLSRASSGLWIQDRPQAVEVHLARGHEGPEALGNLGTSSSRPCL